MKISSLMIASSLVIVSFQNCSKTYDFSESQDSLLNAAYVNPDAMRVKTALNTPVDFQVVLNTSVAVARIEVLSTADSHSSHTGTFSTTDLSQLKLRYSPNLGFRGGEDLLVNLYDKYNNKTSIDLHVSVANPLGDLQPALAVRGVGCVQCHTQLASNLITDFGYLGDGRGHDYFFGANQQLLAWNSGNIYGDHANELNTISITAGNTVTIPKASIPAPIASAINLSTLGDYFRSQFAIAADVVTRSIQIVEKKSVYIGAPTSAQLTSAFNAQPGDRFKYYKDSSDSVELSGIQDQKTFISNNGPLACEGDLFLSGPVYFENLHVDSATGCRIYVLGSLFVAGSITFDNSDDGRNLQITSSKSINFGLGQVTNNGTFCDANYQTNAADPSYSAGSTLLTRYRDMWTLSSHVVRENLDPVNNGASIIAEANIIQASVGSFKDASCRPEGRNVNFERILLNAPIVQSRYMGLFTGTIIAEYTLMSLNTFKFTYDHVFDNVPILPFLDPKIYLNVED